MLEFFGIIARNESRRKEESAPMKYFQPIPVSLACVMLATAPFAFSAEAAGDAEAGRVKRSMCIGCHGIPGYRTAFPEVYSVPKLGGQHAAYMVKALQEYKTGNRSHPSMRAVAAGLSDQDMADLAAYYASGATSSAAR
jgi:cytochrome c553